MRECRICACTDFGSDQRAQKNWLDNADAGIAEFRAIRERLFKSIADRIQQLSQYHQPPEPTPANE